MFDELQFITAPISQIAQSSLSEKLIIVGVVWFVMGRKVEEHFKGLEKTMRDGFKRMTDEILELRLSLTRVETDHSRVETDHTKRLNRLENNVNQFHERIESLEKGVSDGKY